jgi:ribonuclease III
MKLYNMAFVHASRGSKNHLGQKEDNERLEYLGDAVLDTIVAEFLFKKYPLKDEGFLTEIRSRMVNRDILNKIGYNIGLASVLITNQKFVNSQSHKGLLGDALEALIGALYLDRGFDKCKIFVIERLLKSHIDMDQILKENPNYKSLVLEWAQKQGFEVKFEIIGERGEANKKEFQAQVLVNGEPFGIGIAQNKKTAEKFAALQVCKDHNLI